MKMPLIGFTMVAWGDINDWVDPEICGLTWTFTSFGRAHHGDGGDGEDDDYENKDVDDDDDDNVVDDDDYDDDGVI